MKIQDIEVSKIKPDPNQPRKLFEKRVVSEMAQSIRTEGIINPIEVDKNFVIITGETRWRAAKEAGLKTIPCKVMEIDKNERFRRQVIENVQHETMRDWDVAKALEKLTVNPVNINSARSLKNSTRNLGELIGKSNAYVAEHLELLKQSEEFKKKAKKGEVKATMVRALRNVPKKHKKRLERKILNKEIKTRDGAEAIGSAIKNNPDKADDLLKQDYGKCETTLDIQKKVEKIDPSFTKSSLADSFGEAMRPAREIKSSATKLNEALRNNPKESISKRSLPGVIASLLIVQRSINKYLGKDKNNKIIEVIKK